MSEIQRTGIQCGEVRTADGEIVDVFLHVDQNGVVTYYANGGMALAYTRVQRGTVAEMVASARESRPPLDQLEHRLRNLLAANSGNVDVTPREKPVDVTARRGLGRGMSALMAAVALSVDSPAFDRAFHDEGEDEDIYCTICGEFLACDEDDCEAFDGEGVEDEDEYVIEPGFAHDICINAGADLRRWLHFAVDRDPDDEPPSLPRDDMAHWLREGGELGETHALMLLDEVGRLRVERDDARRRIAELKAAKGGG